MVEIKRFKEQKLNKEKWHIQREKPQKQEETKEEPIIKQRLRKSQHAQLLAKHTCITEPTGMKGKCTTEDKLWSTNRKR